MRRATLLALLLVSCTKAQNIAMDMNVGGGGGDGAISPDAAMGGGGGEMSAGLSDMTASNPDGGYTPPDMTSVLQKIAMMAASFTPSVAGNPWTFDTTFGVEYLPTGQRWTYRGDVPHTSGSSPKWIWATAALHSGKTVADLTACAHPTFQYSCNNTSGSIIDLAGGLPAINAFTASVLGNDKNSMTVCHWDYDITREDYADCGNNLCNFVPMNSVSCNGGYIDNYFTANAVLNFLAHIWNKDIGLPADAAQALLDWSTWTPRTGYSGWLGTQLPPEIQKTMHHKPGAIAPCCGDAAYSWLNEIGIIESPIGPYAVVTMAAHAADWKQEVTTSEWASCVIYHAMVKDVPDPFASSVCNHDATLNPKSWTEVPECCPPSAAWGGGTGTPNCSAACVM